MGIRQLCSLTKTVVNKEKLRGELAGKALQQG